MMKRLEGWSADTREEENSPQRSVVVGVKLDPLSKELLTWALVKVAQPGDRVVALHVLSSNELFDQDGKSSLLSLVKAFDSVLAVYEGFCNLKQVDLKLKICRGSSVRKVLVREAKAFAASKVILGVAKISRPIGSSASIAKYCGRKLPRDCCVLAVNNGKVVYQREAITNSSGNRKDNINRPTSLFSAIQRSLSKNSKTTNLRLLEYPAKKEAQNKKYVNDQEISHILPTDSNQNFGFCVISVNSKPPKKKCSICAPFSILPEDSLCHDPPESGGLFCSDESTEGEASDDSLALVPVQTLEAASSSISLLIREVPELRPGWPLLHRAILPNRQPQDKSMGRQISVVQWAMRLPTRHSMVDHPKPTTPKPDDSTVTNLDGESGAMVLVGDPTSASYGGVVEQFNFIPKELESLQQRCSSTCRLFSYHELAEATYNFSPECLIGKGGSSKVYRGRLPDGKELAVKILKPSEDAIKEFILEIEIITNLSHKNIISLIGFCFEDNNLLLVYDFLSRGSLEENLNGEKEKPVIGWDERYKVALGVAEALDYLHTSRAQPVIHRDVKSSNILLGSDFEPQLSDFGLAQLASTSSTDMTSSDVAGTFGYLAPEYFMYGKVTDKIDVYAFGVVLLELLSGRKPISNEYPKGQESLVMWAMPILQSGKYMKLLDPILGDKFDTEKMEKMVMAVSLCLRRAPRLRPRIGLILKLLQGDEEVTKWAKFQVSSAEKFEGLDEEPYPSSDIQSHLNIALLDVEDDSFSVSSMEPSIHYLTANKSLEDYLQGRWSRSSSFD